MARTATRSLFAFLLLLAASPALAEDDALHFTPMFNGKDLSGWVPVNVAPNTFTVKDGVIHSTGIPTGILRTERQYENFVIELEWMHEKPGGNAGLFLWGDPLTAPGSPFARGIEIQILDDAYDIGDPKLKGMYTGHGDVFPIWGATMTPDRPHPLGWRRCLPSERRAKPAGQWNHYRVEAKDGVVKLAVNGKVVSGGSASVPRKGYLCLESEGAPAQFKNIRIAELPTSNPKPEHCAALADAFTSLYTGVDLANWLADPGHKGHWSPSDWRLAYDGKSEAKDKNLWTEKEYGDFVLMIDWRFALRPGVDPRMFAGEAGVCLRGDPDTAVSLGYSPADNPAGQWNRTVITMTDTRVSVVTNEKPVVKDIEFRGARPRGRIGLQHHGVPMELANIFIKEATATAPKPAPTSTGTSR